MDINNILCSSTKPLSSPYAPLQRQQVRPTVSRPHPTISLPSQTSKPAQLRYGHLHLNGTLNLINTDDFIALHARFFDIPSTARRVDDTICKPWTLIHNAMEITSFTWVNDLSLPGTLGFSVMAGGNKTFVAMTDNAQLFYDPKVTDLGRCYLNGNFQPHSTVLGPPGTTIGNENDLILAMPTNTALQPTLPIPLSAPSHVIYPPSPVPRSLLNAIRIMNDRPANATTGTMPKKDWLKHNFQTFDLDQRTGLLKPVSPLYVHRGNEAVFKRTTWERLCFPGGKGPRTDEECREIGWPNAYHQTLFENLQVRERATRSSFAVEVDEHDGEGGRMMKLGDFEGLASVPQKYYDVQQEDVMAKGLHSTDCFCLDCCVVEWVSVPGTAAAEGLSEC